MTLVIEMITVELINYTLQLCNVAHAITIDCILSINWVFTIILSSQMNRHMVRIGWQQGCKHVNEICLLPTTNKLACLESKASYEL